MKCFFGGTTEKGGADKSGCVQIDLPGNSNLIGVGGAQEKQNAVICHCKRTVSRSVCICKHTLTEASVNFTQGLVSTSLHLGFSKILICSSSGITDDHRYLIYASCHESFCSGFCLSGNIQAALTCCSRFQHVYAYRGNRGLNIE